jgi:hypothetical protein
MKDLLMPASAPTRVHMIICIAARHPTRVDFATNDWHSEGEKRE